MDPFSSTLRFSPIPFEPPETITRTLSTGARVLFLVDPSLPLVNLYGEIPYGYAHLTGPAFIAGYGLDDLMRTAGAGKLSPAAVDLAIEERAIGLELEVSPRTTSFGLNTLVRHLDEGFKLFKDVLRTPSFDPEILEVWRGRQLEALRRRNDRPGPIAHRIFNRLMYPNHPLGRSLEIPDVMGLSVESLREAHGALLRPQDMTIGICGDVDPDAMMARLEGVFGDFPAPSAAPGPLPTLHVRETPGVFLIERDLPQATLIAGQHGGVRVEETEDYFATRVLNFILGGSGFTSRLTREMRTIRGYAYSARTSWGATVEDPRALYAVTETRTENAISALELIQEIFEGMRAEPPTIQEVEVAKENMRNSFLFEFELPSQVVNRQVSYLTRGLPQDWFERYLKGIDGITQARVFEAAQRYLRPKDMTFVIVGSGEALRTPLEAFGPVEVVELDA